MGLESGADLDPSAVNLAVFARLSGLTRSKCRTLAKKGFRDGAHGNSGPREGAPKVMDGHEDVADRLLRKGVINSSVIFDALVDNGYRGGLTTVKNYIREHESLVPPKRATSLARGTGMRYETRPGELFQMDWGFTVVVDPCLVRYRLACFAMICHHCGMPYVEFFTNARQENLFIGMTHGFEELGVPESVMTDNMKSVIDHRDAEGRPVWNAEYAQFMEHVGFRTILCKPRHPFTKGKVERLVGFVKGNFLAGRDFYNVTELNLEAAGWCREQSSRIRRALGHAPLAAHSDQCVPALRPLEVDEGIWRYLCPRRRVSFDGFVCYEGRRFGVPLWSGAKVVRVCREGGLLHVYDDDLTMELACHPVTWSPSDSLCEDQFAQRAPEERPTAPVSVGASKLAGRPADDPFARFDFGGMAV
jgi:transposase